MPTDDYSSSTGTSGRLNTGSSVTGNIETSGDQDWLRVSLTAGTTYTIDLEGSPTNAGTLSDTYLRGIYNSSGSLISGTTNDDGGYSVNSQLEFTPDSSGYYYISAGAYSSRTGTYELSIDNGTGSVTPDPDPDPITNDDYSSSTGTSGRLNTGSSVTGNIETANDTDWFRVSLTAGTTYTIDLEGSPTNAGTLSDTYLRGIYNSSGSLISGTTNDDGGYSVNSQLEFTPDSSGYHYISAGAYSSRTGTYELSIDNGTGSVTPDPDPVTNDDYSSSTGTSGRLSTGSSVTGNIETANDTDWFRVSLTEGHTYQIYLEGNSTNEGTLADTYLNGIHNSSGLLINDTANDDGGTGLNSLLEFTPSSTGTYYISTGSYGNNTGTYQLSLSETKFTAYADIGLIGHAWWQFEVDKNLLDLIPDELNSASTSNRSEPTELINVEMGFWPLDGARLINPNDPGIVRDESLTGHVGSDDVMSSWNISMDDLFSGLEFVKSLIEDTPDYNLYTHNCTDAVYEVAESVGLDIETAPTIDILGVGVLSAFISHPSEFWIV